MLFILKRVMYTVLVFDETKDTVQRLDCGRQPLGKELLILVSYQQRVFFLFLHIQPVQLFTAPKLGVRHNTYEVVWIAFFHQLVFVDAHL